MKRKRADRADWPRIAKKRFVQTGIDEKEFCGYVTLFCIDAVHQPLWKNFSGQDICIADQGYLWLQQFPRNAHYSITSIFDAQGDFVRWYIDICKQFVLDVHEILWYDDLYLDIDVSPSGQMDLLDVDELDDALRRGLVTPVEYELAWREADRIIMAIEADQFPLLWLSDSHKERLLKLV